MANNVFTGNNGVIALSAANGVALSTKFNTTNCIIVQRVGNPMTSWKPGRSINAFDTFETGKCYLPKMLADADLSTLVIPPLPGGGGGGGASVLYEDNFTGGAGNITGHTSDTGSAVASGLATLLDGSGNAVFDVSGVSILTPAGSPSTHFRQTAIVTDQPATPARIQISVLSDGTNVVRSATLEKIDSTHVALTIINQGGSPVQQNSSITTTYPVTLVVEYDGTTVKATANGTEISTTSLGGGTIPVSAFVGVNGGTLSKARLENL